MQNNLRGHIRRHFESYKLLVVGSATAALIGAVASIVYDTLGPSPWDVYFQEREQAIRAANAKAKAFSDNFSH